MVAWCDASYPQSKVTRRTTRLSLPFMRPRCDPFDASTIRAAIASGETTERRAYEAYASTAARPYARSSFDLMLRSRKSAEKHAAPPMFPRSGQAPRRFDPRIKSGERKHVAPVKPSNVLTLIGESVSLSVNRGALIASGSNLTFESWLEFPIRARRASLRNARRKIALRLVRRYSSAQGRGSRPQHAAEARLAG